MTGLIIAGGIALIAIVLWRAISIQLVTVPAEERWVIYRFGRFHRLAGPGLVWIWRRCERVERRVNVRDQPHSITLPFLYIYDIPIRFTLDCWYRIDPQEAADGDIAALRRFVQFNDDERHNQTVVRLYDLFVKHMTALMQQHELPSEPSLTDRLLPVLPGQPQCVQLLRDVQHELTGTLRRLGIVLNPEMPITITHFYISSNVVKLLDRNRMVQALQQQLPSLSEGMLLQAASADDGRPVENIQRLIFENEFEDMPVALEMGENGVQTRIPVAGHRNIPEQRRRRQRGGAVREQS